jgi:hypothetical protein
VLLVPLPVVRLVGALHRGTPELSGLPECRRPGYGNCVRIEC